MKSAAPARPAWYIVKALWMVFGLVYDSTLFRDTFARRILCSLSEHSQQIAQETFVFKGDNYLNKMRAKEDSDQNTRSTIQMRNNQQERHAGCGWGEGEISSRWFAASCPPPRRTPSSNPTTPCPPRPPRPSLPPSLPPTSSPPAQTPNGKQPKWMSHRMQTRGRRRVVTVGCLVRNTNPWTWEPRRESR